MIHDLVLSGHGVRLEPLRREHAAAFDALTDDELWFGMGSRRPVGVAAWDEWVAAQLADPARYPFAVVTDGDGVTDRDGTPSPDGEVRGATSYYDVSMPLRRLEIGTTFYGRCWWGTLNNPACKLLLLAHAFETWGFVRVALRCDSRNTRSAEAIQRLGAKPEGVLRRHRIAADGTPGDTAYFSILDDEWPAAREGLEVRLAGGVRGG